MRDQGALTPDEFAAQKARILGTSPAPPAPEAPPPEVAPNTIGDLWVYAILALPLIAAVLIANAAGGASLSPVGKLFIVPALVLILLDHGRLKAAGHRLPWWQMTLALVPILAGLVLNPIVGALSAPIYLFLRARKLRRGYGYVALSVVALLAPILAAWHMLATYGTEIDSMPNNN